MLHHPNAIMMSQLADGRGEGGGREGASSEEIHRGAAEAVGAVGGRDQGLVPEGPAVAGHVRHPEDAARAYDDAARSLRGANARTNFGSSSSSSSSSSSTSGGGRVAEEDLPPFSFEDGGDADAEAEAEDLIDLLKAKLLEGRTASRQLPSQQGAISGRGAHQQLPGLPCRWPSAASASASVPAACNSTDGQSTKSTGVRPLSGLEKRLLSSSGVAKHSSSSSSTRDYSTGDYSWIAGNRSASSSSALQPTLQRSVLLRRLGHLFPRDCCWLVRKQ
uniref:AP2/ERF domain-containing protein n=1 Tax=Ananas comosus var. bracteatus TaxID=296719 RepID=A0A6V7NEG8_ANACO|nr:unnamed protein product [Ananas comosus var. bracteatus]